MHAERVWLWRYILKLSGLINRQLWNNVGSNWRVYPTSCTFNCFEAQHDFLICDAAIKKKISGQNHGVRGKSEIINAGRLEKSFHKDKRLGHPHRQSSCLRANRFRKKEKKRPRLRTSLTARYTTHAIHACRSTCLEHWMPQPFHFLRNYLPGAPRVRWLSVPELTSLIDSLPLTFSLYIYELVGGWHRPRIRYYEELQGTGNWKKIKILLLLVVPHSESTSIP